MQTNSSTDSFDAEEQVDILMEHAVKSGAVDIEVQENLITKIRRLSDAKHNLAPILLNLI